MICSECERSTLVRDKCTNCLIDQLNEANGRIDDITSLHRKDAEIHAQLRADHTRLLAELEQVRVQLAGCGAGALGYADDCKPGDYGWSASLGDVISLRSRAEKAEAERDEARSQAVWVRSVLLFGGFTGKWRVCSPVGDLGVDGSWLGRGDCAEFDSKAEALAAGRAVPWWKP